VSDVVGQFGSPLVIGNDAQIGLLGKAIFRPLSKPKPDAVIPAQRVTAGENQASGRSEAHKFS
jgi:hypothetical protein